MKIKQDKNKFVKKPLCLESIFEPRGNINYVVVTDKLRSNSEFRSVLQPTRMKRKDAKPKNMNFKSLKATLKNIFRTNVRNNNLNNNFSH